MTDERKQRELIQRSLQSRIADARQYLAYSPHGPFCVNRAELHYLWDAYHNKYLDFYAADGLCAIGWNHPSINGAVADHIGHYHNTNPAQGLHLCWAVADYAKKLAQSIGGEDRVVQVLFASDSHSALREATRLACHAVSGERPLIVQGEHLWLAEEYSDRAATIAPGKMLYGEDWLPYSALVLSVVNHHNEPLDRSWVQHLVENAQKTGTTVILDESRTGYGRLGVMWAHQAWKIVPDIIVLGGPGGGGFPFGAIVGHPDFFIPESRLAPASTDNVICQAGTAVLEAVDSFLLEHVTESWYVMREVLSELSRQFPKHILGVWGEGLLCGIVLEDDATALRFATECLAHGLIVGEPRGSVIPISPVLSIPEVELRRGVDVMALVLIGWDEDLQTE